MRVYSFLIVFVCVFYACRKPIDPILPPISKLIAVDSLNKRIWSDLRAGGTMQWSEWQTHLLWSAIAQTDSLVAVGYKPSGFKEFPDWIATVRLNDPTWMLARQQLFDILSENGSTPSPIWEEHFLPVLLIRLHSETELIRLRQSTFVRYVEPLSYDRNLSVLSPSNESSSGCGNNTPSWDIISGVHYSNIAPAAKQSWNYSRHGIPQAWGRCSGKGVKVFVVDTGCSWAQDNLGVSFNTGASYGRTLERIVTLPQNTWLGIPVGSVETSNDACGHGTSMAGVVAAPRCSDGNAVGIAYNCDLITCRAAADVFLDETRELKGVVDAFTNAANRLDVRVISMSMGRITSSSYLADAIRYAYGKSKLIFCAAGTSTDWTSSWAGVIFPASLPEVLAVTGVKDLSTLTACELCHKGPEVDFVVTMERAEGGGHPLTLADSGDWPSTVGGSSVSTASMAGMAALVWSRYPRLTRDQMIVRLQQCSSNYPYKSTSYGWGRLDVDRATF